METNRLPRMNLADCPTNCCPRFDPLGWNEQNLHFKDKLFMRVTTRSFLYNLSKVCRLLSKELRRWRCTN